MIQLHHIRNRMSIGKKEKADFTIECKPCYTQFFLTGNPSEIRIEAKVVNPKKSYELCAFFPEDLDVVSGDSTMPCAEAPYSAFEPLKLSSYIGKKNSIKKRFPETSEISFSHFSGDVAIRQENKDTYIMNVVAATSEYKNTIPNSPQYIVAALFDSKTRIAHSEICNIEVENGEIKIKKGEQGFKKPSGGVASKNYPINGPKGSSYAG